jgi:hypothetical protein
MPPNGRGGIPPNGGGGMIIGGGSLDLVVERLDFVLEFAATLGAGGVAGVAGRFAAIAGGGGGS